MRKFVRAAVLGVAFSLGSLGARTEVFLAPAARMPVSAGVPGPRAFIIPAPRMAPDRLDDLKAWRLADIFA